MHRPSPEQIEQLRREWSDVFVQINPEDERLKRFEGRVGRVVTVNHNGKALVDFADGAWYDIELAKLQRLPAEQASKFDRTVNSAQAFPSRQG